jgi:putative hydrolase
VKDRRPDGLLFRARELDDAHLPRVDSHLHTAWTDGESAVADVYAAAVTNRLSAILFSEHSRKTSADWFPRFAAEVRSAPSSPCRAFVGTECKIETLTGEVDSVPAITDLCDFVTASVHRFTDAAGQSIPFADVDPAHAVDIEFEFTWAALANPVVDIIGHMFGMSHKRFAVTPPDDRFRSLIARAAEFGVAVEVNYRYHQDPWQMIEWCREYDALITFGSDAHRLPDVGAMARLLCDER